MKQSNVYTLGLFFLVLLVSHEGITLANNIRNGVNMGIYLGVFKDNGAAAYEICEINGECHAYGDVNMHFQFHFHRFNLIFIFFHRCVLCCSLCN